jgi:hypothetical protein
MLFALFILRTEEVRERGVCVVVLGGYIWYRYTQATMVAWLVVGVVDDGAHALQHRRPHRHGLRAGVSRVWYIHRHGLPAPTVSTSTAMDCGPAHQGPDESLRRRRTPP